MTCNPTITNLRDILCNIGYYLKLIIPILILLGVVYFIWGVIRYVIADGEEAKKKGKDHMIYGLIGFVVIGALWGLVAIVVNTFGISQSNTVASNFLQNVNPGSIGVVSSSTGNSCIAIDSASNLGDFFDYATCLIYSSVIPLILALAVVIFIWGVVQYVINSDEEAKKEKGKQFMIWGIIGLVVMVGIWGLVGIVGSTFGITKAIPQVPVEQGN